MAILQSQLRLSLLDQVTAPIKKLSATLSGLQRQTTAFANPFRSLSGQILAFGGAYVGVTEGIGGTVGAAIDFESAFANVKKVVDATDEQFENMRTTIRKMSTEMPLAAKDIAALFAAAGESGIATDELKDFSIMASRVGIAFDLTADRAGEYLAKLKTQLGLSVAETGDLADAINHLSNNMASKASDVTDFMLRVSALGKIGGFTAEQIAGIGSAMIAAGAAPEVAGTAMQNVTKALTRGASAKKSQREAAEALGLDLPLLAKQMQKDAPKALKTVLAAIAKAPKDKHISLVSDFFGDEAKAFLPLIGNVKLLDQALDSVSDKTKYSGSAFKEYVVRANTTANVLQLLRNKFADIGISLGDRMLPKIKEAALGIGDVIDSLGDRAHVFAKFESALTGFRNGFGAKGGIREAINDLGDLLFGKADGSAAADQIGLIFVKFRKWGEDVRAFTTAISENPLAKFFTDLAPYGFQIMLWGIAITTLAGTIRKLAAALMFLSGASTVLAALKAVGSIADVVSGGTMPGGKSKTGNGGTSGTAVTKPDGGVMATLAAWGAWVKGAVVAGAPGLMSEAMSFTPGDTFEDQVRLQRQYREDLEKLTGLNRQSITDAWTRNFGQPTMPSVGQQSVMDNAWGSRKFGLGGGSTDTLPGKAADDLGLATSVRIDANSIAEMTRPNGTQDVRVTNQQPVTVSVSNSFIINEAGNAQVVADNVANKVGASTKTAVENSFNGGGGF